MEKELDLILKEYDEGNMNLIKLKAKLLPLFNVSQGRELLLAYHKHLDSFNDPTIYNGTENMIDDYLANNCG